MGEEGRGHQKEERGREGGLMGGGERRCWTPHCGRAFRMTFTSSATAVNTNSNCSCRRNQGGREGGREGVKGRRERGERGVI